MLILLPHHIHMYGGESITLQRQEASPMSHQPLPYPSFPPSPIPFFSLHFLTSFPPSLPPKRSSYVVSAPQRGPVGVEPWPQTHFVSILAHFWALKNKFHGTTFVVYVQCKWLCFVNLSSRKKITPTLTSPTFFQEASCFHLSVEWTTLRICIRLLIIVYSVLQRVLNDVGRLMNHAYTYCLQCVDSVTIDCSRQCMQ